MNVVEAAVMKIESFGGGDKPVGHALICRLMGANEWVRYTVPFGDPNGIVGAVTKRLVEGKANKDTGKTVAHAAGEAPVYAFAGATLIKPRWDGDELLSRSELESRRAMRNFEIQDSRSLEEIETDGPMKVIFIRFIKNFRGAEVIDGAVPEDRAHEVNAALWKCTAEREARIAVRRKARQQEMNPGSADADISLGLV